MKIECICPPKADGSARHSEDDIRLRPRLDFRDGIAVRNAIGILYAEDPDASTGDVLAVMSEKYLIAGIESWTLVDSNGKPVEPTRPNIRALLLDAHPDVAMDVVDEADELYREAVIAPLVKKAQQSSATTPTEPTTSAPSDYSPENQNHSRPSSISTSPTVAIEATSLSPVGGSNS